MGKKLTEFSEEERIQALDRYNIIKPYLEKHTKITELEKTSGINKRNLYRLAKSYKENGLSGLIDRKRSDNGKRRMLNKKLVAFIEGSIPSKTSIKYSYNT